MCAISSRTKPMHHFSDNAYSRTVEHRDIVTLIRGRQRRMLSYQCQEDPVTDSQCT